jgi:hypothetical protein
MHPYLVNWPDGCPPPVFTISADTPGAVVVELAWDPQALLAPAVYPDALRYFTTASDFSGDGVVIPAQSIALTGESVEWAVPAGLWAAYTKEAAKVFDDPPGTTFSCNLYYRVRVTPSGGGTAAIWPSDDVLSSPSAAAAPHIGILTSSAHDTTPLPDAAAVQAAGGTSASPTQWADIVKWCWANLAAADDARVSLAALFAHPGWRDLDAARRGQLLQLWVLAGPSRTKLTELFARTTAGGAVDEPWLETTRGGVPLLAALVDLVQLVPHPDLASVVAKEQLLDDVVTELLDPNGQLDLGVAGSCSATCPQAWLAGVYPAEYVGIAGHLLSRVGKAALPDGSALTLPDGILRAAPEATPLGDNVFVARTNSELAFTAAVLARAHADAFTGAAASATGANAALQKAVAAGIGIEDAAAVSSALLGKTVAPRNVSWPPRPDDPAWRAEQAAVRDALVAALGERRSALVHLFWTSAPTGASSVTHAVLALEADGANVVVRNAQYPGSAPPSFAVAGGTSDLPPRTYRDPANALESLTTDDLGAWVMAFLAPAAALS